MTLSVPARDTHRDSHRDTHPDIHRDVRGGSPPGVPGIVHADVSVTYPCGPDERRLVELKPWGEQHQVMALSRGPCEGSSETCLLPLWHPQDGATVTTALRALALLYFGPTGLLPRIVGQPPWREATLLLQTDDDDAGAQVLLQACLQVEGPTSLRVQVQPATPGQTPAAAVTVQLYPEDADPLHALLRIGLASQPWCGPG